AVLDPEQQRVTVIDDHGQLSSTTSLPDLAMRLLPVRLSNGGLVIMPRDSAHLWVDVSLDGQRGDTMLRPPELRVESPLIGESFVSRSSMGAIVAHRWSSRLAFLDEEGGVRGIVDGIEPVSFPMLISPIPGVVRVDPEATRAARDVGAASGRVYVLFVGTEIVDARVVDVYDEESMSYIGSYRVPANVIGLAVLSDGRLATLEHDPVPVVRIWTMGDPARSELPDGR